MLMIRARDYFQLGFRKIKLGITKQKIFQADGKKIMVLGLVLLSVELGRAIMWYQLHPE